MDIKNAHSMKLSPTIIDRLTLNENIIDGMILSLDEIINLKDPVGIILSEWKRPKWITYPKNFCATWSNSNYI